MYWLMMVCQKNLSGSYLKSNGEVWYLWWLWTICHLNYETRGFSLLLIILITKRPTKKNIIRTYWFQYFTFSVLWKSKMIMHIGNYEWYGNGIAVIAKLFFLFWHDILNYGIELGCNRVRTRTHCINQLV